MDTNPAGNQSQAGAPEAAQRSAPRRGPHHQGANSRAPRRQNQAAGSSGAQPDQQAPEGPASRGPAQTEAGPSSATNSRGGGLSRQRRGARTNQGASHTNPQYPSVPHQPFEHIYGGYTPGGLYDAQTYAYQQAMGHVQNQHQDFQPFDHIYQDPGTSYGASTHGYAGHSYPAGYQASNGNRSGNRRRGRQAQSSAHHDAPALHAASSNQPASVPPLPSPTLLQHSVAAASDAASAASQALTQPSARGARVRPGSQAPRAARGVHGAGAEGGVQVQAGSEAGPGPSNQAAVGRNRQVGRAPTHMQYVHEQGHGLQLPSTEAGQAGSSSSTVAPLHIGAATGRQKQQHRPGRQPPPNTTSAPAAGDTSSRSVNRRQDARGQTGRQGQGAAPQSDAAADTGLSEGMLVIDPAEPYVTCCVCFQDVQAVAVGACNHWEVCAQCCLRMRLLFQEQHCPICKSVNEEVVIIKPPAPATQPPTPADQGEGAAGAADGPQQAAEAPDFNKLMAHRQQLWSNHRWAKGVMVQTQQPGSSPTAGAHRSQRPPLHVMLQRMTARSCSRCDPGGVRPFMTDKLLKEHVRTSHGLALCNLCITHGHKFALEAQLYTQQELAAHQRDAHPRCQFCRTGFYGNDELFLHMQHEHHYCHVCRRSHREYVYFRDLDKLLEHLRTSHHLCEEPDCLNCQTAFDTQEELILHYHQHHPRHLPGGEASRTRPLTLQDFGFMARALTRAAGAAGGGSEPPRNSRGLGGRGRQPPPVDRPLGLGDAVESSGGLRIIDDNRGEELLIEEEQRARRVPPGSWAARSARPTSVPTAEDFPALAAAGPSTATTASPAAHLSTAQLHKATVKCACGRRVVHLALREGQAPPPLECDRECAAAARRAALADAFGVPDPDRHLSFFERNRDVNYSHVLLQAAKSDPTWLATMESQIAEFVTDTAQRRLVMPPMNVRQRGLVHELAEAYGLVTSSMGQDASRRIQMIKTTATSLPRTTLAAAAAQISTEELEVMAATAAQVVEAGKVHLVDVAPNANVAWYFREWSDHCSVSYTRDNTAVVTFTKEAAMKAALATLGGGVRGVFRIHRQPTAAPWAPATPASTSQPQRAGGPSAASSASRGPGGGRGGWLVIPTRKGGRTGALGGSGDSSRSRAGGSAVNGVGSIMDPWLTEDEAAQAEREATEAAIRAAHADDFVFDSWEEQSAEPVSVFPAAVAQHDAAAGPVLLAAQPLRLEDNPWDILDGVEEEEEEEGEAAGEDGEEEEGEEEEEGDYGEEEEDEGESDEGSEAEGQSGAGSEAEGEHEEQCSAVRGDTTGQVVVQGSGAASEAADVDEAAVEERVLGQVSS